MPTIKNRFDFEPNLDAKKKWLSTRKESTEFGVITLPGFYTTTRFSTDTKWWYMALIGELLGVILTLYGGFTKGGIWVLASIGLVVMFVVCDLLFADKLHRNKGRFTYLQNKLKVVETSRDRTQIQNELQEGQGVDFVLKTAIILIALLKVVAILLLGRFNILIYVPIAVVYFFVAYVHITHTGYYWAEVATDRIFAKQHKEWGAQPNDTNNSFNAKERITPFVTSIKLNVATPLKSGQHEIAFVKEADENGEKKFHYTLRTKGIITDNDIADLLSGQNPSQMEVIASNCLKHQIYSIHH